MSEDQTYRIVNLTSENVMRLRAVSISPSGDIIELTGDNAAGKSSVLNSIFMALAGADAIPSDPIHHGKNEAIINLDLGPIKVIRKFKRNDAGFTTALRLESADGASYSSPQKILNGLIPAISLDPLEFSRMKPPAQFDSLRSFVPSIDFKKIEDLNRGDYERRTDSNKRHDDAKSRADVITIRTDLPELPVDENVLVDQIAAAGQHNANIEREIEHRKQRAADIQAGLNHVKDYRDKVAEFRAKADELEQAATRLENQLATDQASLESAGSPGKTIDVEEVKANLAKAKQVNGAISQNEEARRRKASYEKVSADAALESDLLTAKMNARVKEKEEAIAAATMPVEGLGFGDGFVTLHGVPFSQASSAEQLAASVAISMSKNSKLKVIMIRDGSLLDANSWQLVAKMAAENGYQVWCESVFAHTKAAIIIEDGTVKAKEEAA